jgi:hypothetical protein
MGQIIQDILFYFADAFGLLASVLGMNGVGLLGVQGLWGGKNGGGEDINPAGDEMKNNKVGQAKNIQPFPAVKKNAQGQEQGAGQQPGCG